MNLKFRQFTYTAALFTATVLLLLMELTEQNKLFSAETFHCTDSVQWNLCGVAATE